MEIFSLCSKAFVDALSQWSAVTNLKFKQIKRGRAIMDIKFVNRKHRPCPYPLDGRGKLLIDFYFIFEYSNCHSLLLFS